MPPMQRVTTIAGLRAELDAARRDGRSVGLVPTMGYLHEGHLSLARAAAAHCDLVVMTIFVNPLQFAPTEDLATYPRDPEGDATKAGSAGVTLLFAPSLDEMYPQGRDAVLTGVSVPELSSVMEGASRRTHFGGVCTVVAKLFNIVGACRAYFGEKDFQQLAVVRRMAADLSIPVDVVGCPIVREPDGLALSSRNVYLSAAQRSAAPVLHRSLVAAAALAEAGEQDPEVIRRALADEVAAEPEAELDYAAVVDAATLEPATSVSGTQRLLVAARFGTTRLLDNLAI